VCPQRLRHCFQVAEEFLRILVASIGAIGGKPEAMIDEDDESSIRL
jgi:hypothetical protein